MEDVICNIIELLKEQELLSSEELGKVFRFHNKKLANGKPHYSKRMLLDYFMKKRTDSSKDFAQWNLNAELEKRLLNTLQMKPRRTASGVATITVMTKPWPCSSNCVYCPNDLRMPKSYLHDEPACQRAERSFFDPYLQTSARLRVLGQMGHVTDKIELIISGGTFLEYPRKYQVWYLTEVLRALNDSDELRKKHCKELEKMYVNLGICNEPKDCKSFVADFQEAIYQGKETYSSAFAKLYSEDDAWEKSKNFYKNASIKKNIEQQEVNKVGKHRCVGLVVETRPDTISSENLEFLRSLGCTKIQIGVQSLDPKILSACGKKSVNGRSPLENIENAFSLLRKYGFKSHCHFMLNLPKCTPDSDKEAYKQFVSNLSFMPDEIKIYPCSLVAGTKLEQLYNKNFWQPYSEEELLDVLSEMIINTPRWTRISRMIRDISAGDILAGNKKGNLRQLAEARAKKSGKPITEMRYREIATNDVKDDRLNLLVTSYETNNTTENFLEWVTSNDKLTGFLRLSLPHEKCCAMIREVHIYGFANELGSSEKSVQHTGLGKKLIQRACDIAKKNAYSKIKVISAIGTQLYYENLGFSKVGLYHEKKLNNSVEKN